MPDLTPRIVILHPHARRAVELYRLFTGFGYDVASNWPVEELALEGRTPHWLSQAAVYSNEVLIQQAKRLGGHICAADAVVVDAGGDLFWAGFAAGLRAKEGPFPKLVFVGPPGDSTGAQLLVNNASRATQVGHVSEWADAPAALEHLGVPPKVTIPEPQTETSNGEDDVRNTDPAAAPEQPDVAGQPGYSDRDYVGGGES